MGLIANLLRALFSSGRNVVKETAEVFVENAEARAVREAATRGQTLGQFGAEFGRAHATGFDRFMDGLNRLPRPMMAFAVLGLFTTAMIDPIWFAARMQGLVLVPEPLWWLLGVVVSFYFGARYQVTAQKFRKDIAATVALTPQVVGAIAELHQIRADSPGSAGTGGDAELANAATRPDTNPALEAWRKQRAA